MPDEILERILREAGLPELVDVLAARLSPTDLQSLLLEVYRRRVGALMAPDVLRQFESNPFVRPSDADPERLRALDRLAFSLLPAGYEQLELSPVAPVGTISVLAGLSQDRAITSIRNTETLSDSTNVLALEA